MQPAEAFKVLLKRLTPVLRQHGFRRQGQTFYRREDGNWGLVNFQKSTRNTAQALRFTINLGIFSERLGSPFRAPGGGPPSAWICHWRQRIGHLLPVRQDHWWSIDATTPRGTLAGEIEEHVVHVAIPVINQHIGDPALRDLWLTGRSPGATDVMRLRYLTILLEAIGPHILLAPTRDALRQYGE